MRLFLLTISLLTIICSGRSAVSAADSCTPLPKPIAEFTCDAQTLHPTQPSIGMGEVSARKVKLEKKSLKKLGSYLQKHPISVVKGPRDADGHDLYIVDHHHLVRIWMEMDKKQRANHQLQCAVRGEYSNYSEEDFWKLLEKNCWADLVSQNGQSIGYKSIPTNVGSLVDDPYRTLAWLVREKHGYCKTEAPFAEFKWAKFFYEAGMRPDQVDDAVQLAKTCGASKASSLPGCRKEANQACALDGNDD
jgi:hypothetical protein